MKIAHISSSSSGGAGIAAMRTHLGLLNSGIDSSFILKHGEANKLTNIYKCAPHYSLLYKIKGKLKFNKEDIYLKEIKNKPKNYEIVSLPFSPYKLEKHPIIKEADIIHLHWVADFLNYPSFFNQIKQPIVWTLHDMNPFQGIFHYKRDELVNEEIFEKLDKKARLTKLSAIHTNGNISIVSPSIWLKELSSNSSTLGKFPHYVIPNGLDFDNYPLINRKEAKDKLAINNGLKTILFVAHGVDIYRKGFDLLIEAIANIKNKNFNLISVGGEKINIKSDINHIHYKKIDNIFELNKIYSASDVTILPSREDNLPNVMLESMANGTPVISFSNGGMGEHIKTGQNGILLDSINSDSLANAIMMCIEGEYNFSQENIINYAKENFSKELETKRYLELYDKILSNKI